MTFVMAVGRDTPAGARSSVTFDVTLEVSWNSPEAHIQLNSAGVFELEESIPDVLGLCDRYCDLDGMRSAAKMCYRHSLPGSCTYCGKYIKCDMYCHVSTFHLYLGQLWCCPVSWCTMWKVRVTQGRDDRSVHVLVPDPQVLDRGFHDVTIVDIGDVAEPAVSEDDLSLLRRQLPVLAIQSMTWMQSDLDDMRSVVKKRYRHPRPGACTYCGKCIKCNMYRHVSTFHLYLGQLWHCPVSWCTVWKGTCA